MKDMTKEAGIGMQMAVPGTRVRAAMEAALPEILAAASARLARVQDVGRR